MINLSNTADITMILNAPISTAIAMPSPAPVIDPAVEEVAGYITNAHSVSPKLSDRDTVALECKYSKEELSNPLPLLALAAAQNSNESMEDSSCSSSSNNLAIDAPVRKKRKTSRANTNGHIENDQEIITLPTSIKIIV